MRQAIGLVPLRDVEPRGLSFVALSTEPWLTIDPDAVKSAAGRFVAITYRASLWDEPVRPVFRFHTADGRVIDRIAAGPVAGAGIWVGRVPAGTVGAEVSPTLRPGPFGFVIESIRRRSWLGLLMQGFRQNPRSTRSAILTRLIGWKPESDINLAWAIGSTKLADYAAWDRKRRRPVDLEGLDAPRFDWAAAPPIQVFIDARQGTRGLAATLDSLAGQIFPGWRGVVISTAPVPLPADTRLSQTHAFPDLPQGASLWGVIRAGQALRPYALAYLAEVAHRHPGCSLFYGDEEIAAAGRTPVFKPGWSALLQGQRPFLGVASFFRGHDLLTPGAEHAGAETGKIPADGPNDWSRERAMPLRRVLLETDEISRPAASLAPAVVRSDASATIIIPTRDQPAHLRRVVASIRRFPGTVSPNILIIDNGSVEPETKALFETLSRDSDLQVIAYPAPFNFSAMCNVGAAASAAEVLVFLNDDTEALTPYWLDRLKYWAMLPQTGAVGARLTYPDGRLQHGGVLLGMGESAGHFGAFATPGDPGWAGRNDVAHEVSAVTGACLAVVRAKFEAVDGFDAVNLPIELSDIDLCLRLGERGLTTIVDPGVHLLHEESASRGGATFRRLDVYGDQRAYFRKRWSSVLREDPFFHPGLSLYRWHAALS